MGDMDVFKKMLAARLSANSDIYKRDPALWVRSNGEEVWSEQEAILQSVRDNRYTAVHAAHDLGKSFIAARAIAWWISVHPPGSAFVVSTAPSSAQVSAIMWREVGKIHRSADLIGKINRAGYPQWYIDGELVGYGRKPADYEQSAFQGIHAEHVLVIVDEACGVAEHLYNSVDALLTNENARVLAIGNPDDSSSHFAKVCQPGSGWNIIHLDGLRSPNVTYDRVVGPDPENPKWPLLAALMEAEGVPYSTEEIPDAMRPMLVNEQWIEERIHRWANFPVAQMRQIEETFGREAMLEKIRTACAGSPLFTAKVRGLFATSSTDGVIPLGWVLRAVDRWRDQTNDASLRDAGNFTLGVDVARQGDDETCFAHRYGSYVSKIDHMRITDTTEVTDRAAAFLHEPRSMAVVDVIGIGAGVYDLLRRYKNNNAIVGTPIPFNAAARTPRRDQIGQFKFLNDRAAGWWNLRELLDPSKGSNIALPDDEALIEELIAPKFGFNVGGTLKIESKDDIKRRIGRSTDSADALVCAFWNSNDYIQQDFISYEERPTRGAVIQYEGFDSGFADTMGIGDGIANYDFSDL
jgi:hypothetical protein